MANIINFNDDDKSKQTGDSSSNQLQSGGASSQISPVSAFNAQQAQPQAQANQPASSGQFTNIQKYLSANKGAGQQVASGVNNQMQKNLQPGQIQQEDATKAFQSSVQNANGVLNRGQDYNQQLQAPVKQTQGILGSAAAPAAPQQSQTGFFGDIAEGAASTNPNRNAIQPVSAQQAQPAPQQTFDPNSIVNDPNKLTDFTKIRLGQGIDEQSLKNQANTAQTLAGTNQMSAQDLLGQSKTSTGRAGLISQAFNRPNYTQGQQRLDSLFLTGAGKQGIDAVQNQAKQNLGNATNIYNQSTAGVNQAGDITNQESNLQKSLQDRANSLETGYVSNLQNLVPEVNNMRDDERARWQNNFDILTGKKQGQIDNDIYNELQLRTGEHSFNVLNDPNLSLRQIAQISDRNAQGAQDVASQGDVDYYNALAKLSKGTLDPSGNFTGPSSDQLLINGPSDLGRAAAANTGQNSLRGMLDTAQNNFLENSIKQNITGTGSDSGSSGLLGGGSDANANISMNLAKFLAGNGVQQSDITRNPTAGTGQDLNNLYQGSKQYSLSGRAADELSKQGLPMVGAWDGAMMTDASINAINNLSGASGGSTAAAQYRAKNDLISQLMGSLQNQGYNNYVTTTGNKNIDDLMRQSTANQQDRLDIQTRGRYNNLGADGVKAQDSAGRGAINQYVHGAGNDQALGAEINKFLDNGGTYDSFNQAAMGGKMDPRVTQGLQEYFNAYNSVGDANNRLNDEYLGKMGQVDASQQNILNQARSRTGLDNLLMPNLNFNLAGENQYQAPVNPKMPQGK